MIVRCWNWKTVTVLELKTVKVRCWNWKTVKVWCWNWKTVKVTVLELENYEVTELELKNCNGAGTGKVKFLRCWNWIIGNRRTFHHRIEDIVG